MDCAEDSFRKDHGRGGLVAAEGSEESDTELETFSFASFPVDRCENETWQKYLSIYLYKNDFNTFKLEILGDKKALFLNLIGIFFFLIKINDVLDLTEYEI